MPAHVDDDGALRRQDAAVAGLVAHPRGTSCTPLALRELDELDDLLLVARPHDRAGDTGRHERLDELGHRPDVERVHLALAPVGSDPVVPAYLLQGLLDAFV